MSKAHLTDAVTITRLSLHVLGATVWIGGQAVMAGLVPVLREGGSDLPAKAARVFGRLAWPAYILLLLTGFWNMGVANNSGTTWGWQFAMGLKFLAVIGAGAGAFLHTRAKSAAQRGMFAGIGFLFSLIAMVLGVALAG
jgi:putative copper export protein